MALVENISLNIKNSMRCAKKCFFRIWRRQLAACQRLKYVTYRLQLRRRILGTHNLPVERRELYHWAMAAPAQFVLANA